MHYSYSAGMTVDNEDCIWLCHFAGSRITRYSPQGDVLQVTPIIVGFPTILNEAFPGEENNDMFFTIWYGVYNKSTRELTYASGGHPPALFFDKAHAGDSNSILLRTDNKAIGAMPDIIYKQDKHYVGAQTTLYIFSDGVYQVEKSDGSMCKLRSLQSL